jgi:hypothetical protein
MLPEDPDSATFLTHHPLRIITTRSNYLEVAFKQPIELLHGFLASSLRVRADAEFPAASQMLCLHEIRVLFLGQLVEHGRDESSRVDRVGSHVAHDHFDRHVARVVPTLLFWVCQILRIG